MKFHIGNSVDLWSLLEAGSVPLELLDALRLVLLILIGIVVGVELVVGVAR